MTILSKYTNSASGAKTVGMTSPISLAGPKSEDLARTSQLKETLETFNIFESYEETCHRDKIISKLEELLKKWMYDVCISRNLPPHIASRIGGKILPFGSYRLGVNEKGSDIDALCVVSQHVSRVDYFSSFVKVLKKQPEVSDLLAVEGAFVPVIKMKFDGIEIDLLFARLRLHEIPDSLDLSNDMLLKYLDAKCVRSLNGCRVTDELLRLVPNVENFQLTLRAIKLWAKKNGVYSNALGYLGGVSWAILVARTCQLYPNAVAATLIEKFFLIMSQWQWPKPLLLKSPDKIDLGHDVWDPRINVADRQHLMPIITPAYPQQNTTFNVSVSTRTIMQEALKKGLADTIDITLGNATWQKLFERPNFFAKYKHFIVLQACSNSADDQLEWNGVVQSKIRLLIGSLEKKPCIELAHINPEVFPPLEPEEGKHVSTWFIGLSFKNVQHLNLDLTYDIRFFVEMTERFAEKINSFRDGMTIEAKYVKRKELSNYVPQSLIKREKKPQNQNSNSDSDGSSSPTNENDSASRKRKVDQTDCNANVNDNSKKSKNL